MIAKIALTLTLIPTTISQLKATDRGSRNINHWNTAQRSLEHSTTITGTQHNDH
jgi:hypothetical protein